MVKSMNWNSFVVLYEDSEGLVRLQEVLKLFGFPPELAEVFAKNAQALQQQESNDTNSADEGMD